MYVIYFVVGFMVAAFLLLMGYALCKAASDADAHIRRMEDDR